MIGSQQASTDNWFRRYLVEGLGTVGKQALPANRLPTARRCVEERFQAAILDPSQYVRGSNYIFNKELVL
jgi:hypothetical protein